MTIKVKDAIVWLCLIIGVIVYGCGVLNFMVEERIIGLSQVVVGIGFVAMGIQVKKKNAK